MYFLIISLVLGLIFLLIFLIKRKNGANPQALILKTLTSGFFILTALAGICLNVMRSGLVPEYGVFVTIGLMASLFGDVFLDLKMIYSNSEKLYTVSGFMCFAIAHVFYIAATMCERLFVSYWLLAVSLAVAVIVAVLSATGAVKKLMKLDYGQYSFIVSVYVFILLLDCLVGVSAVIDPLINRSELSYRAILRCAGLILFTISDAILCQTYFSKGKDGPGYIISNHLTYYLGQFLIAAAVSFTQIAV
jgi:uncharacterized membrane protein YhhN